MSKKRYIVVGIILLVAVFFSTYRYLGANREDAPSGTLQTALVERRDLGETVLASGLVNPGPGRENVLKSSTQGIVQEVYVDIGSRVEQDMLLLTLESSSTVIKVEKAREALRLAEIQLEELKKGPRPEEVARAQISLEQALEVLNRAEEKQAEYEALLAVVQAELDHFAELDSLSEEEESQRDSLQKEEKQLDEQLATNLREVSNALTQYKLAKEQLSLTENKITAADIEQAEIKVKQARLDVQEAEQSLKGLQVYAPADGVVSAMGISPGDTVNNGTILITILDMSKPVVTAYIDETDVPKLSLGLESLVSLDAFPLDDFEARVSYISPTAKKEGNIIYYMATLELLPAPQNLYPDMTADVAIYMDRIEGVLVVPSAAIRSRDGKTVVYRVDEEDGLEEVPVTTGLRSAGWVEIVEGVKLGEKVLTGELPQAYH